jgi:radical SAM protein with 4Fe4S-binding SPASM domain
MPVGRIKFANQLIRSNLGLNALPYKIIFAITKECHSRCRNCKIWSRPTKDELTIDEISTFARNSPFIYWLTITGGEPTDRQNFAEIVKVFSDNCPNLELINFSTNGLNTDRIVNAYQDISEAIPKKLFIHLSIDGPPEVNDKLRGIKGDFHHATNTLRELRKIKKIKTRVAMTLYKTNSHLITDTVSAIQRVIPDFTRQDLHINLPHRSMHFYGNLSAESKSDCDLSEGFNLDFKVPWSFDSIQFLEHEYQKRIPQYLKTGKTPIPCTAVKSSLYISEKGEVFPCTIWNRSLGNIRNTDYSISKIFEKKAMIKDTVHQILNKKCPNCWSPCQASHSILDQALKII